MNVQCIGRPNQMTDTETKEHRVADDVLKRLPRRYWDGHIDSGFHKLQKMCTAVIQNFQNIAEPTCI
jgi:hypothetical protein